MSFMRRSAALGLLLLILSVLVYGCAAAPSMRDRVAYDPAPDEAFTEPAGQDDREMADSDRSAVPAGEDVAYGRKVIQTASLQLEVTDIRSAVEEAAGLVSDMGGFVAESSIRGREVGRRSGHMVLRVPQDQLDETLEDLRALGEVTGDELQTQDVTEEYVDLEARIRNLKRQEDRLLELLGRADTVEEVLQVERELGRVRADVESLQGRLDYLRDRVDLATVRLSLTEVEKVTGVSPHGFQDLWERSVESMIASVNRLLDQTADMVVWLFGALPMLIVLAVFILLLALILPRLWRKRPGKNPPFRKDSSSSTD